MDSILLSYLDIETAWIITGVAIAMTLLTLLWLIRPMIRVGAKKSVVPHNEDSLLNPVKASVIVYGISNDDEVMEYLEALDSQDYPNFDIVLVMDTSADNCAIIAEQCAIRFSRVYVTFIPPGSHNLSRRKLALTLGMKAAKGDVAVITVSNAQIPSTSWLSSIMAPFCEDKHTEVVLGYSKMNYTQLKSASHWYKEFDALLTNSQWIGYALNRKPYRGDGYNIAFRRHLFFEHKGYAKSIYLHSGDDDLFISEIARPGNTKMVLSPDSILTINWGLSSNRIWTERKEQYRFTSRWLRRGPFIRAGLASAMQWIVTLLCAAAIAISTLIVEGLNDIEIVSKLMPGIVAILIAIIFWQTEIIIYRKAATNMSASRLWWAIPIFSLWRPIGNFIFSIRNHNSRIKNYTWRRQD